MCSDRCFIWGNFQNHPNPQSLLLSNPAPSADGHEMSFGLSHYLQGWIEVCARKILGVLLQEMSLAFPECPEALGKCLVAVEAQQDLTL